MTDTVRSFSGSGPGGERPKASIVLTIMNEERNIRDLMDSLVTQEPPLEVVVVDAGSRDRTIEYVGGYVEKYDFVRLYHRPGTRGESRNFGLRQATGEIICFIDGDCISNPFWLEEIRRSLETSDIVAGKTINIGYHAFEELERAELFRRGYDVSFPSCNIGYRAEVLRGVEGFDPWFVTAEDIDLNLRAVDLGYAFVHNDRAIVYHRTRGSFRGFVKQAFWNGYGRKQLTLKHGRLWQSYDPRRMFETTRSFWALVRLAAAFIGYGYCKLVVRRRNVDLPAGPGADDGGSN